MLPLERHITAYKCFYAKSIYPLVQLVKDEATEDITCGPCISTQSRRDRENDN